MAFTTHLAQRLVALGVEADVAGRELIVRCEGITSRLKPEDGAEEAFEVYRRARSSQFDVSDWSYTHNATIEVPLARLDQDVYRDSDDILFTDERGNTVTVHRASQQYIFAHFDSTDYERYFRAIVRNRLTRPEVRYARSMNILFRSPVSATYAARGRRAPVNLKAIGLERIRSCLTKLAIERHACYEVLKPKPPGAIWKLDTLKESDWLMPRAAYEPNLVNYYKVARSSPFASQSFLAYYHVLEYYFLRVAEDSLHHQLRTQLNRTDFKVNTDGLDKVIALIRKHGSNDDETDMLRKVLQRFVSEDAFIEHVNNLEATVGEKIYTRRRPIFGEQMEISLKEGHALSNAAKTLKHIRNAIVHSSDRYKRDECHIPLTESEDTIGEYIPLVKYFAEQVIYGTATAPEAS
jgi:hypothetical protein